MRGPDLIASIQFVKTDEGGRRTACKTGYRGTHNFGEPDLFHDAVHEFIECEWVAPGELVTSRMWLVAPEYLKDRLYAGFEFTVQEGTRVVGHGRLLEICNHELRTTT